MALTLDKAARIVHDFIAAHQTMGHRFEVDAEACLPMIRCWDHSQIEILVQSAGDIDIAVSMAMSGSASVRVVVVPSSMVPATIATIASNGASSVRVQPYWTDESGLHFGYADVA